MADEVDPAVFAELEEFFFAGAHLSPNLSRARTPQWRNRHGVFPTRGRLARMRPRAPES